MFKVAGKMYAVAATEPVKVWLSFKCSPEIFAELIERPGIIPAPYMARAQWVGLETPDALRASELKTLLKEARELVIARMPKTRQAALGK